MKITKIEIIMVAIVLTVCGTCYGIWRVQTSEEKLVSSTSVLKTEKKQRVEKPTVAKTEKGFDVKGSINVEIED